MENWERGTRNAGGARVRTFASDVPRKRESIPRSGYIPFQYAKSFGSKTGTGLRFVPECTPATVAKGYPTSAAAGRHLPDDIAAAAFVIRKGQPQTEKAARKFVSAVDTLYAFLQADANRNAANLLHRYGAIYTSAEKRRGVWDNLHSRKSISNVQRYLIEKERYSPKLIKMLMDAVRLSGYAF